MDLQEFKKQYVQTELGITADFGKIVSLIDFGNVNYWFEEDRQTHEYIALKDGEKLFVSIEKLEEFLSLFSSDVRFYYGKDSARQNSLWFIQKAQEIFGKHKVFTKSIQKIKHYLGTASEKETNTRILHHDGEGDFVYIPKCNFDVEISVDAIKILDYYDTVCLLSSDADFLYLLKFLKQKGKQVILIKGGHVIRQLKAVSNLVINAQDIKKHITGIKQKPGTRPGLADRNPESTGRTTQVES
ncbi:MAG: NYN domain-containing protein [bacterium]|nr:NYN domain-containing protein [bacterium]